VKLTEIFEKTAIFVNTDLEFFVYDTSQRQTQNWFIKG